MSVVSEVLETGSDNGASPKTPKGRNLIQGRLPFTAVDNKNMKITDKHKHSLSTEHINKTPIKAPSTENDSNLDVAMNEDAKLHSILDESDEHNCIQSSSYVEEEMESELDTSHVSLDELGKTTPSRKPLTPKQFEREKKKLEKIKEKEEKGKKKAEEKAEKERLKREKEEEKKRKEEEKEVERKKKEEEKKKKEEEKEAEKKRKEEEKKKKEDEREAEKRRKEEDKRRKEEEKENEKRKKEEEERRKKERLSQVFTNFFTQKKTSLSKSDSKHSSNTALNVCLAFPPFQVKENMRLAPVCRTEFDSVRQEILDKALRNSTPIEINRLHFKGNRGRRCGATWPISKDCDVEVIDEDDAPLNKEDILTVVPTVSRRMRPKLFKFSENRRPAYWGTWRKKSNSVGPRRPFGKDILFDYEVDSDDEWEEEMEPGESLTDSEGEGEEKEPADDYEVDNEFLVPHGYLSDEEGEKEEDERPLSPSVAKEKLKLKEEQFERELKEKTCHIKPSLIGCCWIDDLNLEPQVFKVLQRYTAVVFAAATPIRLDCTELICESGESPMVEDSTRSEKAMKRLVNDNDIPVLVRLLHGSSYSKLTIVKEFFSYLERNKTDENKSGPSKAQVLAKISEIASWSKCTEAGNMNGRTCWLVHSDILERYNLSTLPIANTWEFTTETKKRGRKADDSRTEEDTPPAKTPRVSLIKKFTQSANKSTNNATNTDEKSSTESKEEPEHKRPVATPKAKKRITLISLPISSTKTKSTTEQKVTPLTNFLRKMSAKEDKPSESLNDSAEMEGIECLTVE